MACGTIVSIGVFFDKYYLKKQIISGERLKKIENCEMESFGLSFFFVFSLIFPLFSFNHHARRFPQGKWRWCVVVCCSYINI